FAAKETAFIYTAQLLIFLGLFFIYRISKDRWPHPERRSFFFYSLIAALLLIGGAGVFGVLNRSVAAPNAAQTAAPAIPGQGFAQAAANPAATLPLILIALAAVFILVGLYFLIRGYTWARLRQERSFDLMLLNFTMVLPMLAPLPVKMLLGKQIDYSSLATITTPQSITINAIFITILVVLAVAIGLLWKPRIWAISAAIFYTIFIVFFTTVFTNGYGVITGMVGALGYWLEQQGVNRGSQPWYYYVLIQIPMYEFLPALGSLLAIGMVAWRWVTGRNQPEAVSAGAEAEVAAQPNPMVREQSFEPNDPYPDGGSDPTIDPADELTVPPAGLSPELELQPPPTLALLIFWSITSIIAYSYAGEKMPWLTVHITLPMILLAAWSLGQVIEKADWSLLIRKRGWIVPLLLPVFLFSLLGALGSLLGAQPPFMGKDLESLRTTTTFLSAVAALVGSGIALFYLVRHWPAHQANRFFTLFFFAFLALLTARTAIRASYINYDYATEYLVYAHAAPGVKQALAQIEEISRRTTDGLALQVAYDNETAYPFFWYLRNYPNAVYYGATPTRSLRDAAVILVSDSNYGKIEPIVGQGYYRFDYIRLWWPNQDYFGLTRDRLLYAITNPQMRSAIFQVWFNRDYTAYGQITNKDMSTPNWNPAARMRMYVRKDIVAKLWNYGAAATTQPAVADPYEGKQVNLSADKVIGAPGSAPGQLQRPRDLALAADGSLYVADTDNNRIQHLAADGSVLHVWGTFADISKGEAPGGTLDQPWGIAVGKDGSVFVADTWNHRIQKFTSDGKFIKMWGYFGQAEKPEAFWGPRDVAVDSQGRVYVTDTGNKRVVVFDADGNFITQFGSLGLAAGQFDEEVGIAVDQQGKVYVADTWNQRIQVFAAAEDGSFKPANSWDVAAWYGQSLDNKPFIAVDNNGHVFATDPEGYRVLEFTGSGQIVRFWGDLGNGPNQFGLAGSVAVDPQGGVWVSDTGNSRLMHFTLPQQ
ncbi:MAG TPA: 6-bladed beta-propeller, partial [Anaerolineales bacterium]